MLDNIREDLIVEFKGREAQLEQNKEYISKVKDLKIHRNIPTMYGVGDAISVKFEIYKDTTKGNLDTVCIKQRYFLSKNKDSRFGQMYKSLTDKEVGNKINLAELIDKKCLVLIDHYESKNGDVFDNISKIKRLNDEFDITQGII